MSNIGPHKKHHKITILTAIWKRPKIVKIFLESYLILKAEVARKYPHIELNLVIVKSGGEKIPSYVTTCDYPNDNLVDKWNNGALACRGSDYVIMLGSDDIIHISYFDQVFHRILNGFEYIYVLDFYFFDTVSKKMLYWAGYEQNNNPNAYQRGAACGAGRVLSKRLMEELNWKPWQSERKIGLDTIMDINLRQLDYSYDGFSLKETNSFAMDIKGPISLTPFGQWGNTVFIDTRPTLKEWFDYKFIRKLLKL